MTPEITAVNDSPFRTAEARIMDSACFFENRARRLHFYQQSADLFRIQCRLTHGYFSSVDIILKVKLTAFTAAVTEYSFGILEMVCRNRLVQLYMTESASVIKVDGLDVLIRSDCAFRRKEAYDQLLQVFRRTD